MSITLGLGPCFPEWLQVLCHGLGFPGSGSMGYIQFRRISQSSIGWAFLQQVGISTTGCLLCQQGTVSSVHREQFLVSQQAPGSALWTFNRLKRRQEVLNMQSWGRNGSSWLRVHYCEVEMKPTGSAKLFRLLPDPKTTFKIKLFHRYLENQKIRVFPYIRRPCVAG